jgi:catechol 2,3-dioxygenase-like lactoylglutathione lyase family enzyme
MVRITDPERSRSFYEALGFTFAGDFDIVRDAQLEATNYFLSPAGSNPSAAKRCSACCAGGAGRGARAADEA